MPWSRCFRDAGQARSRRQFDGQAQFAGRGLAPEPLWYDRYPNGLPRQVLVYRWMEGEALTLAYRFHNMALADAVARVHITDRDDVQRFSPHPFNLLTFWQIWQAGEGPLRRLGLRLLRRLCWPSNSHCSGRPRTC